MALSTTSIDNPKPWIYFPEFVNSQYYWNLEPWFRRTCAPYKMKLSFPGNPDRIFEVPRISCIYQDMGIEDQLDLQNLDPWTPMVQDPDQIPIYSWLQAPPELNDIRRQIENYCHRLFDYVLVHIYRDGNDSIGWHRDREALDNDVASISLGAPRAFQFRPISWKKSYQHQYHLHSGDMVFMKGLGDGQGSCQRNYKHHVPPMRAEDYQHYLEYYHLSLPPRTTGEPASLKKRMDNFLRSQGYPLSRINLTFRFNES